MSKRKADEELTKFVWKRNPSYDITLLSQVEAFNPFAYNNAVCGWTDVAEGVIEVDSRMAKVTYRSCRERTMDLLRLHRKNDLASTRSSETSDNQLSQLQVLLANFDKMESTKPNKQLKALYTTKDKNEAEAERSRALDNVTDTSEEDNSKQSPSKEDDSSDFDYELDVQKNSKNSNNPKQQLVNHLQAKSQKELALKKEELRFRDKETELKSKELELKSKELDLMHLRAQNESDERKQFMELLVNLALPKKPE